MRAGLLAVVTVSLCADGLWARDYFVSPAGNDAAAGTRTAPFATVGKAASLMEPGDTCWLRAGTYRETVVPARSGKPGKPIAFRGYQRENAIISGADIVPGPWSVHDGRVHKAAMPWTMNTQWWTRGVGGDQVFIKGVMVPEARWPNLPNGFNPATIAREQLARATAGEVLDPGDAKAERLATVRYRCKGLPRGGGPLKGTRMFFVSGCQWTPMTGTVTEAAADGSVTFSCKAFPDMQTWDKQAFVYHARANDSFYLWGSMLLLDSPGEWVRDEGGALSLWLPNGVDPSRHPIEAKRRNWAFDLTDRAHVTIADIGIFAAGINSSPASTGLLIDGVDARYVSHGTWFDWWWGNPVEYGDVFRAGGIHLHGAGSEIRNSRVEYSAGVGVVLTGNDSRAVHNVIRNVGYAGTGAGISARGSKNEAFVITRNTVYGTGYQQCVDVSKTRGTQVTHNDLSDSGRLTVDNGALFGHHRLEDVEIAYNRLHDSHSPRPEGWSHYYGNTGIYLQDKLVNVRVHHNAIWNCWGGINFVNIDDVEGVLVSNNTVLAPLAAPPRIRFVNNISVHAATIWPAGVDEVANLVFGPGSPIADPGFVNAKAGNFALRPGSPAIDRGATVQPVTDGFTGEAPDMGAYESKGSPWQAGATPNEE